MLLTLACNRPSNLVAIKILRADKSVEKPNELAFHEEIRARCTNEVAKARLVMPINDFWEDGVSGRHQCLVFEPTAYDAWNYIMSTRRGDPQERNFRYANARVIMRDLLLAMHSLHSCGIVHGNPSAHNMLAEFESEPPRNMALIHEELERMTDADFSKPMRPPDSLRGYWAPTRSCLPLPLWDLSAKWISKAPKMRLADLSTGGHSSPTGYLQYKRGD